MTNIWAKNDRNDNLLKLQSLLTKRKELNFKQLREGLHVSEPTALAEYVKLLESQGKIEHFDKAGDRRSQWYRIKAENAKDVETQLGKYEAIRFIKSIPKPVYKYKTDGKFLVAAFITNPHDQPREIFEKKVEAILSGVALRFLKAFFGLKPREGKLALVIMLDAEKEAAKE